MAGPGSAKLDDGELTLGRGAVGNVGNMVADLEVLELGNDAIGARAIRREQEPVGPSRAQCQPICASQGQILSGGALIVMAWVVTATRSSVRSSPGRRRWRSCSVAPW